MAQHAPQLYQTVLTELGQAQAEQYDKTMTHIASTFCHVVLLELAQAQAAQDDPPGPQHLRSVTLGFGLAIGFVPTSKTCRGMRKSGNSRYGPEPGLHTCLISVAFRKGLMQHSNSPCVAIV